MIKIRPAIFIFVATWQYFKPTLAWPVTVGGVNLHFTVYNELRPDCCMAVYSNLFARGEGGWSLGKIAGLDDILPILRDLREGEVSPVVN